MADKQTIGGLAILAAIIAVIAWAIGRTDPPKPALTADQMKARLAEAKAAANRPGWRDLSDCSFFISFDGTKSLSLSPTKIVKANDAEGHWDFDPVAKHYVVTIAQDTKSYSLLRNEDAHVCILVSGTFDAADLEASWFGGMEIEPDDPATKRAAFGICAVVAVYAAWSAVPVKADTIDVKYYGALNLDPFACESYTRSSFINRICYDKAKSFMVIQLKAIYYPYCGIDANTVSDLRTAESMGRYYNSNVKGHFDCRITPAPKY